MRKYGSNRFGILACSLAVMALAASGCGADGALGMQDWQRDLLGLFGLPPIIPIFVPGGTGAAGPAGPAGAPGVDGPNIIIARAVVNADGTVQVGQYVLLPDEVEISLVGKQGLSVESVNGVVVALSTEITPELELEGDARDLVTTEIDVPERGGPARHERLHGARHDLTETWWLSRGDCRFGFRLPSWPMRESSPAG